MKRKLNIREKRMQTESARQESFRKRGAMQETHEQSIPDTVMSERNPTNDSKSLNPPIERKLSSEQKSTAKAAGLKSVFILNDRELLMTSFGRGNEALREKHIIGKTIKTVSDVSAYNVSSIKDIRFRIDGRVCGGITDNPLHVRAKVSNYRDDLIHARRVLEFRYFGREFSDNIHIQLIYNILDIEKLLTFHINNIIYTLNNYLRIEGNDLSDPISDITLFKSYEDFQTSSKSQAERSRDLFSKLCNARQLGYINIEVVRSESITNKNAYKRNTDPDTVKFTEVEFFYALYAIGYLRQMLAHGNPERDLYSVLEFRKRYGSICSLLDKVYAERVDRLNAGFLKMASKNLVMLFRAFQINTIEAKAELVRDYYDFTVRRVYKNLGFSIKILREHFAADIPDAYTLRDQRYDTVRGKLYPFIDFTVFRFYKQAPDRVATLIEKLRASTSELEKDSIYAGEAKRVWTEIREVVLRHILPNMNGNIIKSITADPHINRSMLDDVLVSNDATVFSKLVYLLTLFINGKEINDLLTTLINKFDNIASFIDVMNDQNIKLNIRDEYSMFAMQSKNIANELRVINSFARMSRPSAKAKECMYVEALKVLGIKEIECDLGSVVNQMLDPSIKNNDPQKHGLRNFIANNVIESERFKYLIRYGNVNKLKGIAQNRSVVAFVLKDIPDSQVLRYYNSIYGSNIEYCSSMREELTDRLTGFSFDDIKDVQQNDRYTSKREQEEKRQKQALVRLYLTVLYLALKNLVYINSRYFLAFHCVERDRMLLYSEKWEKAEKNRKLLYQSEYGYSAFARDFLTDYPPKKRVAGYLSQNMQNSDEYIIRVFRNKVEHLDAVRNADMYLCDLRGFDSWFELYHYIIQRCIMGQYEYDCKKDSNKNLGEKVISPEKLNPKTLEYFDKVRRYRTCCKDFIKAMCIPFAYNLPRYKNLCIGELFDRNDPPADKMKTKSEAMAADDE